VTKLLSSLCYSAQDKIMNGGLKHCYLSVTFRVRKTSFHYQKVLVPAYLLLSISIKVYIKHINIALH